MTGKERGEIADKIVAARKKFSAELAEIRGTMVKEDWDRCGIAADVEDGSFKAKVESARNAPGAPPSKSS